jgi:hypothetical protein
MRTLLLSPRYTSDSRAVREAAFTAGWKVFRLASRRLPEGVEGTELVVYGEPGMVDVVAWAADVALLRPTADWLTTLPEEYRKRAVRKCTLSQARESRMAAFVKPAFERKSVAAQVYTHGATLAAATRDLPGSLPILVADPVDWEVEYRFVIVERRWVASSPYLRNGAPAYVADGSWPAPPEEREDARAFLTQFLNDTAVALPAAVVVDIGRIRGAGWAVIEANAVWAAGLYGCEAAAVLPALARAAVPRAAVTTDSAWINAPRH